MVSMNRIGISVAAFAALATAAQAGVTLDFEGGSYTAGSVITQGTPAWEGASNTLLVNATAGKDGGAGLITSENGYVGSYPSLWYRPNASVMGGNFVAGESTVQFSFDIKLVKSDTSSSTLAYRIYMGANSLYGATEYATLISIYTDGKVNISKPGGSAASWTGLLSDKAFHTISGSMDYSTRKFSLTADNDSTKSVSAVDFATGYASTDYTTFGGFKFNVAQIDTSVNQIALDNISFALVPEPAAVGILGLGALALLRKQQRS